jgi:hypothetical protein
MGPASAHRSHPLARLSSIDYSLPSSPFPTKLPCSEGLYVLRRFLMHFHRLAVLRTQHPSAVATDALLLLWPALALVPSPACCMDGCASVLQGAFTSDCEDALRAPAACHTCTHVRCSFVQPPPPTPSCLFATAAVVTVFGPASGFVLTPPTFQWLFALVVGMVALIVAHHTPVRAPSRLACSC